MAIDSELPLHETLSDREYKVMWLGAVTLSPERDSSIKTHLASNDIQPLAA